MEELTDKGCREGSIEAESFRCHARVLVGAEDEIHDWTKVGVVAGSPICRVVPSMKLGCAKDNSQGAGT